MRVISGGRLSTFEITHTPTLSRERERGMAYL